MTWTTTITLSPLQDDKYLLAYVEAAPSLLKAERKDVWLDTEPDASGMHYDVAVRGIRHVFTFDNAADAYELQQQFGGTVAGDD